MEKKDFDLNAHSSIYSKEAGKLNQDITSYYNFELVKKFYPDMRGKKVLLLGLGDSYVNSSISALTSDCLILEGSSEVIKSAPANLQKITVHTYFENYIPETEIDLVIGTHILEHVKDPVLLLSHMRKKWVSSRTRMLFTVPSADSLHRKIGVAMGLLGRQNELNAQDIELGHQRVYTIEELQQDCLAAGLNIIRSGGFFIKMVSHKQMKDYSRELMDAIFKVSLNADPHICSNLWIEVNFKGHFGRT